MEYPFHHDLRLRFARPGTCAHGQWGRHRIHAPCRRHRLPLRFGNYPATLLSAIITSLISCSQTLAVILTSQLCGTLNKDKEQFAEDLEDTAIVIPAVIPWSIACAIVLAATSAPLASIPYAFYLYLLPLWKLIHTTFSRRSKSK